MSQIPSHLVELCVSFFMMRHSTLIPIKRTDLTKYVFGDNNSRKVVADVLEEAKKILRKGYGIDVVELTEHSKKYYMLVNSIPETKTVLNWQSKEKNKHILLFLVLSVIFMNGETISETALWTFLKKCGLNLDDEDVTFGNIRDIIKTEFTMQRYLTFSELDKRDDEIIYSVSWGPRSKHEVNKKMLLNQVAKIYKCETTEFPEQYTQISC